MMYTIKPKGESIISWLLKYGTMQHHAPVRHRDGNAVIICMYKDHNGPIARVCYDSMQLYDATRQCQTRIGEPCRWFWVPIHVVKPFMHGQEIR